MLSKWCLVIAVRVSSTITMLSSSVKTLFYSYLKETVTLLLTKLSEGEHQAKMGIQIAKGFSSVQFSRSVVSNSWQPHGL